MKVLIISTSTNDSNHVHYGNVVDMLIDVVGRKGKNEVISKNNTVVEYVNFNSLFSKYFNLYKTCERYIKEKDIDLISTDEPFAGLIVGYFLKKRYNIPLNVQIYATIFENFLDEELKIRLISPLIKLFLKKSDSVRAMSNTHKNMLSNVLNLGEDKIYSCPPLYKISNFTEAKNDPIRKDFKNYSHIMLFVGRLSKQKDIPTLLYSMRLIIKRFPKALCLIIGNGPEKKELLHLANKLKISGNVKFLGTVPNKELSKYFLASDVFVLPSVRESLGVVLVEAGACKKPVVTTATVGARELIMNGVNGFVVPLKDYRKFAEKVIYLFEHSDVREKMGQSHFERVNSLGYLNPTDRLHKVKEMWEETIKQHQKE